MANIIELLGPLLTDPSSIPLLEQRPQEPNAESGPPSPLKDPPGITKPPRSPVKRKPSTKHPKKKKKNKNKPKKKHKKITKKNFL